MASILRSLARFGADATIAHFDVIPGKVNKLRPHAPLSWSVRAVRY